MAFDYIEQRETSLYIIGSRVPIDRVVCDYRNGDHRRPSDIKEKFERMRQ